MKNRKIITALLLAGAMPLNFLVYQGGRLIAGNLYHFDLSSRLDAHIPVLPWMVLIYWGLAVPFWTFNHCLCAYRDKYDSPGFIMSHYIGHTLCFLFFVLFENVASNAVKYAEPAADIMIRTIDTARYCGFSVMNTCSVTENQTESNGIGIESIRTMMHQMNGSCTVEQTKKAFEITLLFPQLVE